MKKLKIIYEDKNILVVNKEQGLLTVSTEKEKTRTLFHEVYTYLKQKNKNNLVFIVHRLDKDTSGLVLFAKSEKVKYYLQNNWESFTRKYYAIVSGSPKDYEKLIDNLSQTKTNLTYVSKYGKQAITEYQTVKRSIKYSLLDVNILTGRKNQIRVQLSTHNLPILGDNKYGINKAQRMYLHAYYLKISLFGKEYEFNTGYPKEFNIII